MAGKTAGMRDNRLDVIHNAWKSQTGKKTVLLCDIDENYLILSPQGGSGNGRNEGDHSRGQKVGFATHFG